MNAPDPAPVVPTVDTAAPDPAKLEQALAFAVVVAAIKKATGGRKTRLADMTGTEKRRARRILERRERRFRGVVPVGALAPAMCRRTRSPR